MLVLAPQPVVAVRGAWFWGAGGMIVGQNEAGGVVYKPRLDYFAWVDAGVCQSAAK